MARLKWEKPVLHSLNTNNNNLVHAVCTAGSSPSIDPGICTQGNGASGGGDCARGNGAKGSCGQGNGARLP
jgi:hypothetical protein